MRVEWWDEVEGRENRFEVRWIFGVKFTISGLMRRVVRGWGDLKSGCVCEEQTL
jgi:hypothetical protein